MNANMHIPSPGEIPPDQHCVVLAISRAQHLHFEITKCRWHPGGSQAPHGRVASEGRCQ